MAGRIRTLKPEILDDAATARLTANAYRLIVGLILIADDHGNARADATYLRGAVFHSAPDAPEDVDALVTELSRKLVDVYIVGDERYVHLRGWSKHQRISNAGEPRVPLPPGWRLEVYEKAEGNRLRRYARSFPPAPSGAAPPHPGAAPTSSRQLLAPLGAENGAAGSPISDHDLRSPTTTTAQPLPAKVTPTSDPEPRPEAEPEDLLESLLAESTIVVDVKPRTLAVAWRDMARRKKRDDDDLFAAADYAVDALARTLNKREGVGDIGAFLTGVVTRLLEPGGLEAEAVERKPRPPPVGKGPQPVDSRELWADAETSERKIAADAEAAATRKSDDEREANRRWNADREQKRKADIAAGRPPSAPMAPIFKLPTKAGVA